MAVLFTATSFCIIMMWLGSNKTGPVTRPLWFYDLGSKQLFIASSKLVPPIDAPSGPLSDGSPAGVRAYVFTCGDCADPDKRFIGWLERNTTQNENQIDPRTSPRTSPRTAQSTANSSPDDIPRPIRTRGYSRSSRQIRSINDDTWVAANSSQGFKIRRAVHTRCTSGSPVKQCYPDDP